MHKLRQWWLRPLPMVEDLAPRKLLGGVCMMHVPKPRLGQARAWGREVRPLGGGCSPHRLDWAAGRKLLVEGSWVFPEVPSTWGILVHRVLQGLLCSLS